MRQILPFINLNGKIVDQKSPLIPILDQGFLYGTGIFTTLKVREGHPLFLNRHLNRLQTSARQLNIQLPSHILNLKSYIQKAAYATLQKNKLIDGGIRITITPSIFCIHAFTLKQPRPKNIKQFNHETIKLISLSDPRDIYKTIKTTYRLPYLLAKQQAQAKGAQDALFTQNHQLIESTTSNIIASTSNNIIITPPIAKLGLNGITRQLLMEILPIKEVPIPYNTTYPLILINSLSLKIAENIDGRKLKQNNQFTNLIRQTIDKAEKYYIEQMNK